MRIVGHYDVRSRLESPPPVSLIQGPSGVGKRLIAMEAAKKLSKPFNLIEVGSTVCTKAINGEECNRHTAMCFNVTGHVAEYLIDRCRVTPRGVRSIVFDAGRASVQAANALLKLLEEPPKRTHFIMYTSTPVLPTIVSRAERLPVGPLADGEVKTLLREWGVPEERLGLAAELSAGRPGKARRADEMLTQRGAVMQFLKAGQKIDRPLLSNAVAGLHPKGDQEWAEVRSTGDTRRARMTAELYAYALVEARTARYRIFTPTETFETQEASPKALDTALRTLHGKSSAPLRIRAAVDVIIADTERRHRIAS